VRSRSLPMAWVARRLHPPRWGLPCVPCCVLGYGRFSRRPARGRASCLGVFKRPPLRRSPPWSPLPPTLPPASARCRQAPCSFRPRGLSPPRRFAPPERSQACCILLPTMGFTGFRPPRRAPRPQLPAPPESVSCLLTDAPPFRAFPTRVAVPASPPAAPSSPFTSLRCWLDPEVLLHTSVRCCRRCCHIRQPVALLGFPS